MIATLLTFGFAAAALFALATRGATRAKGRAAAPARRRELAACGDSRDVTLRCVSRSADLRPAGRIKPERGARRMARLAFPRPLRPHRAAA
jgi:hypothetical protein